MRNKEDLKERILMSRDEVEESSWNKVKGRKWKKGH